MEMTPTNSIEHSLTKVDLDFVHSVAARIRRGLGTDGYQVVKTADIQVLNDVLSNSDTNEAIAEARRIVDSWT